jgi:hypothetical protein
MIQPRGRAPLAQLSPWLRAAAIAAALVSLLILLSFKRIAESSNPDWFLLANRTSMVWGLTATVSAIGALSGGRLSRASKLVMGVAICIGLAALVYGAWLEIVINALNHACWTGNC